jgi:hypothetical protein
LAAKRTLKRRAQKVVSDWALDVSLDHLVGAQKQRLRDLDAERLGGLQIDDKRELGRLLSQRPGRASRAPGPLKRDVGSAKSSFDDLVCS